MNNSHMKANSLLCAALLIITGAMATGCDFFRTLAGRPTSETIETLRQQMEADRIADSLLRAHIADSIALERKAAADSIAAQDSLRVQRVTMRSISLFGGVKDSVSYRYAMIVAAFRDAGNASSFQEKLRAAGYDAKILHFGNGYSAVAPVATNNVAELYEVLSRARRESFCPSDFWVAVNE